ncbi:ABC transporter permease [Corynebacterium sp. TAE3-ERU12]|uniref:ABC transporter permease subunit n=1 Tax=Corynebacterium sp. TAE3-ERU12 TaxID=2849491 RepID=UPI001C45B804|nr:ABC transporter permease subunit [Corynebacterium sp. TAE3-ERU12]MBV7295969.1 ABC transporter permease [Corynebacterium sp. TAE3-ERU12]
MIDTIRAEWVKLRTSRSTWLVPVLLFILVGIGAAQQVSILQDPFYTDRAPTEVALAQFVSQVRGIAPAMLLLLGVFAVTGEYSSGLIRTTALAEPSRWKIVASKILVAGLFAVVMTGIAMLVGVVVGWLLLPDTVTSTPLTNDDYGLRLLVLTPVDTFLMVAVAVGLAFVLKRAAGVIVLLVLWLLLAESIIPTLPKVGETLAPWRPATVFDAYVRQNAGFDVFGGIADWAFGWAGLAYPMLWVVAIVALGIFVFSRRDVRP